MPAPGAGDPNNIAGDNAAIQAPNVGQVPKVPDPIPPALPPPVEEVAFDAQKIQGETKPLQLRLRVDANTPKDSPVGPRISEIPHLQRIGFVLAMIVLAMMTIGMVFVCIWAFTLYSQTLTYAAILKPTDAKDAIQLFKDQEDFLMKIAQMMLLNLLLPILTAILGYIFGANLDKSSSVNGK